MTKTRASIFDNDDLAPIDISSFAPKPIRDESAPPPEAVRAVSEAAHFPSREAQPHTRSPATVPTSGTIRVQRRHRTGRNVQFNIRASQETVDAFYALADREGWVLGETLEYAVAALERELTKKG